MPTDLLNNFEMQKYQNKVPNFNGVYSKTHLPKIKDWAYP